MKVRKAIKYNNGGTVSGTSEYGRRHDRLRDKSKKLRDKSFDLEEKGKEKKAKKVLERGSRANQKALDIKRKKDAQ